MSRLLVDKLFKTESGNYVVGQKPNPPIIIAAIFYIVYKLSSHQLFSAIGYLVSILAILYWAILEVIWGVNNFRRLMGLIILIFVTYNLLLQV